jgi:nicotinamide phosphoribosyltransferase
MRVPLILRADSYKYSHFKQYRPGMKFISSYIESRGSDRNWKEVVNAGIQYHLNEYFSEPLVTAETLKLAKEMIPAHGVSFNEEGFRKLLEKHGGYAPVHIQSLPEGLVVPVGTPMLQIVNTDPEFPWLPSFLETSLLRSIWYMSTVATQSFHIKRLISDYMLRTAGHTEGLDFKLHDFGARGVSSSESAQIGGAAHLFNFMGSDTVEAIYMLRQYYGATSMPAFSIDAAEHSTVTSFGGPEYEREAYEHLLNEFGTDNRIFAIVSDSYDLYSAIDNIYGDALKRNVEALGPKNAKLVVRPDSGDPVIVVSDTIERLMDKFGHTTNQKGYKVLPSYLGVIQGDGVNETSIRQILAVMQMKGLSAENIAFGMGGALLQGINRDTLKFAMKANEATHATFNDGKPYPVFKQPKTDAGKNSKKGRQAVIKAEAGVLDMSENHLERYFNGEHNLLETVYLNGEIKREDTLTNIRERVNTAL